MISFHCDEAVFIIVEFVVFFCVYLGQDYKLSIANKLVYITTHVFNKHIAYTIYQISLQCFFSDKYAV